MRKRTGSLQISPRRLLSLLLIHILVVFAVSAITGVSSLPKFKKLDKFKDKLTGGNSYVKTYLLMSRCSGRLVRMNPSKKADAKSRERNDPFAKIIFKSVRGEDRAIRIQGELTQRYLCFSRRGRPLIRYNGKSKRCQFHEIPHHGYIKLKSVVANWYLGFNRHGRRLRGFRPNKRHRYCNQFTKIPVASSSEIDPPGPLKQSDLSQIEALNNGKR